MLSPSSAASSRSGHVTIFLAKIRDFPFVAMSVHNNSQGSWSMLRRAVLQETWGVPSACEHRCTPFAQLHTGMTQARHVKLVRWFCTGGGCYRAQLHKPAAGQRGPDARGDPASSLQRWRGPSADP